MKALRLRTQLVITAVVLIMGVTAASLLVMQYMVRSQVQTQVESGVRSSLRAFQDVRVDRENQLSRTASLLSELPTLKALMATQHASTVQDGSTPFWTISGADLFILAAPDGNLLAYHLARPGWNDKIAAQHLRESLKSGNQAAWWFDDGRLYWVSFSPLTAGEGSESRALGYLAIGYEVNASIARELARSLRRDIAEVAGGEVIASTLSAPAAAALKQTLNADAANLDNRKEVSLNGAAYTVASARINESAPEIRCYVLMPFTQAQAFLLRVNRTILVLGLLAIVIGGLLFSVISRAITRPLENVIGGVKALADGDYGFSIDTRGSLEVEQLGQAFAIMRERLLEAQRHQLAAERVAALGRTASSISHDLRHYLAAVVANAEFLSEAERLKVDRNEIYREIKTASDQMLDLIDSLRDLSRDQPSLTAVPASLDDCARHAIEAVDARQGFRDCTVNLSVNGDMTGVFDPRKIERALFNLILNSCEAVLGRTGKVLVDLSSGPETLRIELVDNGHGIPESIRGTLFDPFVSFGKTNGTGLGLAIVCKIVQDHGGTINVKETSVHGTTIELLIPRFATASNVTNAKAESAK